MSEDATLPDRAVRAFEGHDAFERTAEWFELTTTKFDGRVTASETDDWAIAYTIEVRAPMLSNAAEGSVGSAVEEGWFETYELRLADAAMPVRHDLTFEDQRVIEEAGDAVAIFEFEWENADQAPGIVKAIVDYVEGTYLEGIVPGYEYGPPVSTLLSRARQSDTEGDRGPMPL